MANLKSSSRAMKAIALIVAGSVGGYATYVGYRVPDDVALAGEFLIGPWEGNELHAYADPATGGEPYTICRGDTKGVRKGMVETPVGCDKRTVRRMMEFRANLVACIPGFEKAPLSWRAMMDSLTWNIGDGRNLDKGGACNSSAATLAKAGKWVESCIAATRYNRAAGKVMRGLVARRGMGDANRMGEAEVCLSGLEYKP